MHIRVWIGGCLRSEHVAANKPVASRSDKVKFVASQTICWLADRRVLEGGASADQRPLITVQAAAYRLAVSRWMIIVDLAPRGEVGSDRSVLNPRPAPRRHHRRLFTAWRDGAAGPDASTTPATENA